MNARIIKSLYKKEMLDVLRDKKTVLMMLVVPLVLYPLLFIVGMQVMTSISSGLSEHTYSVVLDFSDEGNILKDMFKDREESGYYFEIVDDITASAQAVNSEEIDAYVRKNVSETGEICFDVYYASAITNSSYAANMIVDVLKSYGEILSEERVQAAGLDVSYILHPVTVQYKDVSSDEESAGSLLGTLLPFMLVISLLLGTMYPAIDTTAGERERGTLETVLTLPVTNRELIFSKFLTVATIGIVSAILNIIAMCGVGIYMYQMVLAVSEASAGISMVRFVPAIIIGILCVFAFAIFISAVTMCVCAFAKTYKEANNYITPLTLVVMFASFIGFIPNVTLSRGMALIPIANICLLIRDLLLFKMNIGIIAIVLVSNIAYGIIAIMLLGKIYNSEAILFGDSGTGVQIFERRSNMKKGGVPTLGDMWLVAAITAVVIIYAGGAAQLALGYYGVLATQLFIIGIPLFAAWYTRKDMRDTFRIKKCHIKYFAGGIIMIVGAILLGIVLTSLTGLIFKSSAAGVEDTMNYLSGTNFLSALVVVAVVPAICEEMMFRGYIFSALEARLRYGYAILSAACLFGIYHMSIVRFFTTALLGAVICYVAHKSKSIFPGILMHFMNNGLSVVTMYYPQHVARICPVLYEEKLSVFSGCLFTLIGGVLIFLGILIVSGTRKVKK